LHQFLCLLLSEKAPQFAELPELSDAWTRAGQKPVSEIHNSAYLLNIVLEPSNLHLTQKQETNTLLFRHFI
jgi:hypothetical protein